MTEFITRNYGNKEYEIIIKTDSKEHYKATEDFARRLIDHAKPMTVADYIRNMTDEELAELLCGVFDEDECDGKYICGITIPDYDEYRIREWLKSEVKE